MRIAFIADALDQQYGGIHVYTKQLLKALSKVDKNNEYIILRINKTQEFDSFEEIALPYPSYPGYRAIRLFAEIPLLLSKKGVDVVVEPAHFGPFNLPKKIKRVTVIHDMTTFLFPQFHLFHSQLLQKVFLPSILKRASQIITNSEHTTKDLIKFFPFTANKTTPTLLGKDEIFKPTKDAQVLEKYKIPQPYILYLGTLEPRKNIPVLIQAFNEFKTKTGLPHKLVLVGKKGWKFTEVFNAINESKFKHDILLPGYVAQEHLPILYSMAEVFVYPSTYEGFGLPVLEAMSCGAPVITTNVSSIPEVGGEAAHYFSPNSVVSLVELLVKICRNSEMRNTLSKQSLKQAVKFNWEKTAAETIKVFEKCV